MYRRPLERGGGGSDSGPRDGSPRDGTPSGTPCFELVRSIWLPRTWLWIAVNAGCGAAAYALSVMLGRAVLWMGVAAPAAWTVVVAVRALEDRILRLSPDVVQDRAASPIGPLCMPSSALAAALCVLRTLVFGLGATRTDAMTPAALQT